MTELCVVCSEPFGALRLISRCPRCHKPSGARCEGCVSAEPVRWCEGCAPDVLTFSVLTKIADVERAHVRAVLEAFDGNKTLAARSLGISRRTMYNFLEREGERQKG